VAPVGWFQLAYLVATAMFTPSWVKNRVFGSLTQRILPVLGRKQMPEAIDLDRRATQPVV
jgi:hypothetical protein